MRIREVSSVLLLALTPGLAVAQSNPAPPEEALPGVFGEVLDVRVVNLEVVVTDRQGQRVYGLQPGDFRLEIDGVPTNIEYFTEVRGGTAVEVSAEAPVPGVPALAAGSPVGTSYLLFVDDYFALERDRNRALDGLIAQLPNLGPEDRMAVVAYDGKRLTMLSSWSGSVPALERALKEASRRPARGLERVSERRSADLDKRTFGRARFDARRAFVENRLSIDEKMYADKLADQVQRMVSAATATLRSFASPPGRKVMMVLSGGWPYSPAEYAVNDLRRPVIEDEVPGGEELFRPFVDTANLLGYTVYSVDLPGLDTEFIDATVGEAPGPTDPSGTPFTREHDVHRALRFIAEQTGGRAMINAVGRRPLEVTAEDTRSYYWIGFRPQRKGDDRRREVRVTLANPELRARLRGDYLDFSRGREVSMAVESSLLFGNTSAAGGLTAKLGTPKSSGMGRLEVPLELELPASSVTFLPTANGYASRVELRVAAMDDSGNLADIPVIPLDLQQAGPATPDQKLRFATKLQLRKREHQLVIALYDVASDQVVATNLSFAP
jgi:VWFA-related protein